jgi:hypothetical protein
MSGARLRYNGVIIIDCAATWQGPATAMIALMTVLVIDCATSMIESWPVL